MHLRKIPVRIVRILHGNYKACLPLPLDDIAEAQFRDAFVDRIEHSRVSCPLGFLALFEVLLQRLDQ